MDLSGSAHMWVYRCAICIIRMFAGYRQPKKKPNTLKHKTLKWAHNLAFFGYYI